MTHTQRRVPSKSVSKSLGSYYPPKRLVLAEKVRSRPSNYLSNYYTGRTQLWLRFYKR